MPAAAPAAKKKAITRRPRAKTTVAEICASLKAWGQARFMAESNAAEQTKLRDEMKAEVERQGYADDKGSLYLELGTEVEIPVYNKKTGKMDTKIVSVLKNERRVAQVLNEDKAEALLERKKLLDQGTSLVLHITDQAKAIEVLQQAGLLDDPEAFTIERMLDEEAILALRFQDKLTQDDIDSIFDIKETFAFLPQEA